MLVGILDENEKVSRLVLSVKLRASGLLLLKRSSS